jgi:1-acyl-sn-glycerol-3-phosphate acyltransferase
MSLKWIIAKILLLFPFRVLFRLKVVGNRYVPRKGPCIICVNHTSFWDPPFVGMASPRELHFLAKKELFEKVKAFGLLISFYNAVPIDREKSISGMKKAIKLLKDGKAVVIFPEGTRNRTNSKLLLPLKDGASLLSIKLKVPVIPAFLFESKGSLWDWVFGKRQLKIRFGKPIFPEKFEKFNNSVLKLTREIECSMRELYARG